MRARMPYSPGGALWGNIKASEQADDPTCRGVVVRGSSYLVAKAARQQQACPSEGGILCVPAPGSPRSDKPRPRQPAGPTGVDMEPADQSVGGRAAVQPSAPKEVVVRHSRAGVTCDKRGRCSACGVGCRGLVPHDLLPNAPVCRPCFSALHSLSSAGSGSRASQRPNYSSAPPSCRWCGCSDSPTVTCMNGEPTCASRGHGYCERCITRNFSVSSWRDVRTAYTAGIWQCYACTGDTLRLPCVGAKVAVTFEEEGSCVGEITAVESEALLPGQFHVRFDDSDEPWCIDPSAGHVFEVVDSGSSGGAGCGRAPKRTSYGNGSSALADGASPRGRGALNTPKTNGTVSKMAPRGRAQNKKKRSRPRGNSGSGQQQVTVVHKGEAHCIPLWAGPGGSEVLGSKLERKIRQVVGVLPGQVRLRHNFVRFLVCHLLNLCRESNSAAPSQSSHPPRQRTMPHVRLAFPLQLPVLG